MASTEQIGNQSSSQKQPLPEDSLPTSLDIIRHYYYLIDVNCSSGKWRHNTPLATKLKDVTADVAAVWDRSGIPHHLHGRSGEKRILSLIRSYRNNNKRWNDQKGSDFLSKLFDVAMCQDTDNCKCSPESSVPDNQKIFLADQRGERILKIQLTERKQSLRSQETSASMEKGDNVKIKSSFKDKTVRNVKKKGSVEVNEKVTEDEMTDDECDEVSVGKYNTQSLKNFARECDRYRISDRAGAKVANALLIDLGLVTKKNKSKLICPTKLRRERKKWGEVQEKENATNDLPYGLYTDGKRVPTLVREERVTKLAVPGGRGRGATRIVKSSSNNLVIEDHYPVAAEPGGKYITHVTPENGEGRALAVELADVVRERGIKLKVIGMDGCPVNTGVHNGAIRLLELDLGEPVQHVICGLHLNELLFWHILQETDGVTSGPDKLTGPIGSTLNEEVWKEPVVNFKKMSGKVPFLPEDVVKDLSRDQNLGYRYCLALQAGWMPDNLATQGIGPVVTSC